MTVTDERWETLWPNLPDVPLDPELEATLQEGYFGQKICHPLMIDPLYVPIFNYKCNQMLADKKRVLQAAYEQGDWDTYFFLHERPFRSLAMMTVADHLTDREYWSHLAGLWIDSEFWFHYADEWEALLKADRPGRIEMMHPEERDEYLALPNELVIYQGHTIDRTDGWSWTLNKDKAVWFAKRFADLERSFPVLSRAKCSREDVVAYFTRRGESEVMVFPENVRGRRRSQVR